MVKSFAYGEFEVGMRNVMLVLEVTEKGSSCLRKVPRVSVKGFVLSLRGVSNKENSDK